MTTADLVRFYAALALIALTIPALLWACRKDRS